MTEEQLLYKARPQYDYKSDFLRNPDKYSAYFLGIMWADGYISKTTTEITLAIQKSDADDIHKCFPNFGISNIDRSKYGAKTMTTRFTMRDIKTHNILTSLDYQMKSGASANKVLNYLPESLKHYWWLGYFNGDGWAYYREKPYFRQLGIASCYEQNWDFFENLAHSLNIKFAIQKRNKIKSSSSNISINNTDGILKFKNYIYQDYSKDFGFLRKKEKIDLMVIPHTR